MTLPECCNDVDKGSFHMFQEHRVILSVMTLGGHDKWTESNLQDSVSLNNVTEKYC